MRRRFLAGVIALSLWPPAAGAEADSPCRRLAGPELAEHLSYAEMMHGESDALRDNAIDGVLTCLRTNAVCLAATGPAADGRALTAWSARHADDPVAEDYDFRRHDLLLAVVQTEPSPDGPSGCVAAIRLLINAQPWWVKGWTVDDGIVMENGDLATSYPAFTMGMPPRDLIATMQQSYAHWLQRLP